MCLFLGNGMDFLEYGRRMVMRNIPLYVVVVGGMILLCISMLIAGPPTYY